MSYARFISSDVYVYQDATPPHPFVCIWCSLLPAVDGGPDTFETATHEGMIAHLREHQAAGHRTANAIPMLERELDELKKGVPPEAP